MFFLAAILSLSLLVVTSKQLLSQLQLGNRWDSHCQAICSDNKIQEIDNLNLDTVVNEHVALRRLSEQHGLDKAYGRGQAKIIFFAE